MRDFECDVCSDEYGKKDFNYCSRNINGKCIFKYK